MIQCDNACDSNATPCGSLSDDRPMRRRSHHSGSIISVKFGRLSTQLSLKFRDLEFSNPFPGI